MDESNPEHGCKHEEITFSELEEGCFTCHTNHLEKYKCVKCGMSSHFLLDFYKFEPRQNPKCHTCTKCNSFQTYSNLVLEQHQVDCKMNNSNEYRCEHCSHRTDSLHALKIHNLNYHTAPEDITSFECPHCSSKSRQFAPKDSILEHIESSRCDFCETFHKAVTWLCTQCPYKTPSQGDLAGHVNNLHKKAPATSQQNGIQLHGCDYCPFTSKRKMNLKRHVRDRHIEHDDSKYFKCNLCPFKTFYKNCLGSHNRWKHGTALEPKSYGCEQCPFTTKEKWYLKEHRIRKHTAVGNIQWIKCQYCPYTAKMGTVLKRHIRMRHSEYGTKMWVKCAFCSYKAINTKELKGHVRMFHVEGTNEDVWDHSYALKIVM